MHAKTGAAASITLVLAGVLVLTGCAAERPGGGGGEAVAPAGPTSEVGHGSAAPSDDPDADVEHTDAPDASATPMPDPESCLHGTWTADNNFFLAQLREFGDEITGVNGEVILTFEASGEIVTEYRDWTISARSEGADITIVRSGTDRGTFEASTHTLSITETQMGTSISVSGGGVQMSMPTEPAVYVDAAYTCGPSSAVVTTRDGAMTLTR